MRRAIWIARSPALISRTPSRSFRIRREVFDPADNRISKDVVHGVTNLDAKQATPKTLAGLVKKHWRVAVHHKVRDVVYREDHPHAHTATSAHLTATLRNLTLALLRLASITQLTRTIQRTNADRTRILPPRSRYQHKPTMKSSWGKYADELRDRAVWLCLESSP